MDNSQNGEKEYDTWILLSRVYHMIAKLRRLELAKYNVQPVQAYILFILHALGDETVAGADAISGREDEHDDVDVGLSHEIGEHRGLVHACADGT